MDDRLKKALEFSNYQHTFVSKQKLLKEKVETKLTFGYNSGVFRIDRELLTFIEIISSKGRDSIVLLDINNSPILIANLEEFKSEIFDRYFEATNEYHLEYEKLKKSRSVEKLLSVWPKVS